MSVTDTQDISSIASAANNWLLNSAIPLWYDHGVDWRRGGFFESLDINDLRSPADFKRLRVLTRQIYVFAAAHRLGAPGSRDVVEHGVDFLLNKAKLKNGGFANKFNLNGEIVDIKLDLYDLAFCLFALAHAFQILQDSTLKAEALSLTYFICDNFRHKSGGFIEAIPTSSPRRQNPHMHLLEAMLAWQTVSEERIFKEISKELVVLFFQKFYFPDTGALLEYFDENLNPLCSDDEKVTEPGHHLEWVWLLDRFNQVSQEPSENYASLYRFAKRYGVSEPDGFLFSQVLTRGRVRGERVRLWPHAEWLKAELVTPGPDRTARVILAWRALSRFLDCPRRGLWFESYDLNARCFISEPAPASSLYHITLGVETLCAQAKSLRF